MIKNIIDLLRQSEFYGCAENIDIAKGINEVPKSTKDSIKKIKRQLSWKRK
jgi:hypothetical protein